VLAGAPVSLHVVTLYVGAGCVVVHGSVLMEDGGARGEVGADEVAATLRAVGASAVLMRLLPEGARLLDGDTAVLQLGDGAPPMEFAFSAADGRVVEALSAPPPAPPPGVPLLSSTWPLLAVPRGGSGSVHLQFGMRELARALGQTRSSW
jgi:hypothetical protein